MIRLILVALLAIFVAACGTQQPDEPDATLTPEPTPEATSEAPEPTDDAEATDDGGGSTGSLEDVIPDELNGVAGTPIPGMEAILQAALQGQGLDAGEAEFAFVNYGDGADAIALTAFRIPGVTDDAMEQLARLMSGVGAEGVEVETEDVSGKSVLSFTGGATTGVMYFYVVDDIAFTVVGEDAELAAQLLAELP